MLSIAQLGGNLGNHVLPGCDRKSSCVFVGTPTPAQVVATEEVVEEDEEVWNDVTTNASCGSESAGDSGGGGGGGGGGNGPILSVAATASGGAGAGAENGSAHKSQRQNSQPQSQVLLLTDGEEGAGGRGSGRNVGGGAVAGTGKVKDGKKAVGGEPWGKGIGAGAGGSAATMLPYQVMVTDSSGIAMKGYNHEVSKCIIALCFLQKSCGFWVTLLKTLGCGESMDPMQPPRTNSHLG